jgi:hypothetical protein
MRTTSMAGLSVLSRIAGTATVAACGSRDATGRPGAGSQCCVAFVGRQRAGGLAEDGRHVAEGDARATDRPARNPLFSLAHGEPLRGAAAGAAAAGTPKGVPLIRCWTFQLDQSTGELTRNGKRVGLQDQPAPCASSLPDRRARDA